jgi:hypothetical protein
MPRPMTGVLALLASPSDAAEERAVVRDALIDWTVTRGRRDGVALLPWMWERHAVAKVGGRPQALLNGQAVDQADVVVAFFDSRLGTETGVDVSGTAEEINRAVDAGKPVHVYFSSEPLPRAVDPQQIQSLREFQAEMESRGVMGRYTDLTDLSTQVVRAIEADIEDYGWSQSAVEPAPTVAAGAELRFAHVHEREARGFDKRGKMQYRTVANDLVVQNAGSVPAEDLTFTVDPVGGTQFAFPEPPVEPFTLPPHSEMSWLLIPTPSWGSSGNTVRIVAKWREGEERREVVRTVTLRGG